MQQSNERRSSPRHPYTGIVEVGGVMAVAHDISKVGLAFYLRYPLAVGTVLDVAAGGSVGEPAEIRTNVVVARVESHAKGYLVGVRFPHEINVGERPAKPPVRGRERSGPELPRPRVRRRDLRTPFLARTLR